LFENIADILYIKHYLKLNTYIYIYTFKFKREKSRWPEFSCTYNNLYFFELNLKRISEQRLFVYRCVHTTLTKMKGNGKLKIS